MTKWLEYGHISYASEPPYDKKIKNGNDFYIFIYTLKKLYFKNLDKHSYFEWL